MKCRHVLIFFAILLLGPGCGTLDTSLSAQPDKVLTGTITYTGTLPAGAEVLIRVIEPAESSTPRSAANDLPAVVAPMQRVERLLGEARQTLSTGATQPIAFKVEYVADDALLRRGLSVDVRISVAGKLHSRTLNGHIITARSSVYPQDIRVQPVQ